MAPVTFSAPLREHLNETHTKMHDAVITLSKLVEEAMPDFRRQVSLSRTNTDSGMLCNNLGGLNEAIEALQHFNRLSESMTSKNPKPAALANQLMDIASLNKSMDIRNIGSSPTGQSITGEGDVSIRHLLQTHGQEIKDAIKTCIKQCPVLEQQKLNERFRQVYPTGRSTERA